MSNSLNRLQKEAFAEIVDNSKINNFLAGKLKKFAGLMAIALAMSAVTFDSHADQKTANKIAGLLTAGAGIGYLGGNTDTAKALGAAAAGAYAGGYVGKGNGATAASVVGATLAYGYVNGSQNQRKLQQQQQYQNNGYGYNNGGNGGYTNYNNGNYNNGNYNNGYPQNQVNPVLYNNNNNNNNYNYPQRQVYQNQQQPRAMILYQVTGQNNFYVTVENSLAIKQFNGQTYGNRNLSEDSRIEREINVSYNNYVKSYHDLEKAYQEYEYSSMNSNVENDRIRREMLYSTDPNGSVAVNSMNNRGNQLYQVKQRLEKAATNYGVYKGTFFTNVDNAAFEGFDVRGYSEAMNYIKQPEEVRVTLNGSNKFPIVRDNRVAFTLR